MLGSSPVYLELSAAAKSGMRNVSWISYVGTDRREILTRETGILITKARILRYA